MLPVAGAQSDLRRRSGVPTEALAGRKAGTDQGTAIVRSRLREFQKASARQSPEGSFREVRERVSPGAPLPPTAGKQKAR